MCVLPFQSTLTSPLSRWQPSAYTCLILSYLVFLLLIYIFYFLLSDLFLFTGSGPCFNSYLFSFTSSPHSLFLDSFTSFWAWLCPTHWWLISVRTGGLGRYFPSGCMRWKRWGRCYRALHHSEILSLLPYPLGLYSS